MNHCKICGNNIPDEVEDCHQAGFGDGCMKTIRTMNQIPNIEETHDTREWEKEFNKAFPDPDWLKEELTEDSMPIASRRQIKDFIHQQLQKARQDWLREEIVKLEGMKKSGYFLEHDSTDHALQAHNRALQTIIDQATESKLDQDKNSPSFDERTARKLDQDVLTLLDQDKK